MAKFKLGDKVTDGNAVYEITGIDNGFGSYEWKLISGRADPSHSEGGDFGWADAKMKIANSCACNSTNPVVAKAMNAVHETMYMGRKVKVIGRMMGGDDSLIGKEGVIDKIDPAGAYHLKGFDNDVWFKQSSLETVNACGTARNAKFATDQYEFDMLHEAADKLEEVAKSIYYQGDKSTYAKYKDEIKRLADRAFRISQHG